jgi:DNA-binding NarL/FixJ family response regulator
MLSTAHDHPLRLTDRQTEVLAQIADGASNKEIARMLALPPATVKAHVAALFAVLGVANRMEVTAQGRRRLFEIARVSIFDQAKSAAARALADLAENALD